MHKVTLAVLSSSLCLAGCKTTNSLPAIQTIDVSAVSAVQAEIKRQVGVYVREANADRAKRNETPADVTQYWCGSGALDFEINTVKIDLLTSRDVTNKANVGLKIPISAFTLGPSLSHSYEATNVEELVYNEWLVSGGAAPDQALVKSLANKDAPIARILLDLRDGLIDAAKKSVPPALPNGPQSCFAAYNIIPTKAADDPGNSIKIAFTAVSDDNGGVSLDLGVLSLGGSSEAKQTGSSTITVTFREVGSARFKPCADDATKICDANGPHLNDDHYILRIGPKSILPNGILPPQDPPAPPVPKS